MKENLVARREQAEHSFNELAKQKDHKEAEIKDLDTEMARLQGEWRLLGDLLSKTDQITKAKKVSPRAEVIDVAGAVAEPAVAEAK